LGGGLTGTGLNVVEFRSLTEKYCNIGPGGGVNSAALMKIQILWGVTVSGIVVASVSVNFTSTGNCFVRCVFVFSVVK
jgi:hypothetical protein